MPCSDGCNARPERDAPSQEMLKAMICAVMSELEKRNSTKVVSAFLDRIDWEEAGVKRSVFEGWWKKHKKEDEKRRAAEAETARLKEIRKQALRKLTADEIAALNVKP